ncbi:MAG: HD domain-containing protein [Lachnospiraceae bacterium]|nr:HD domain-containing protein [Lachnospiraceae bacterium]
MSIVVKLLILCSIILMIHNLIRCIANYTMHNDIITEFKGRDKVRLYAVYSVCALITVIFIAEFFLNSDNVLEGVASLICALFYTLVVSWAIEVTNIVKGRTREISETLIGVIEAGDTNLDGHSILVMDICMLMYEYLPSAIQKAIRPEDLRYASLFLDVGKLGIPSGILNKPGKLEDREWNMMKRHPEIGVKVLKQISSFDVISDWIMYHHERIDGTGYYGLSGEDIPIPSKMIAVADTYAAIVMVRSYKPSRSYDDAVSTLKLASGTQLDPQMVEVFLSIPREKVERATVEVIGRMKIFLDEDFRED